MILVAFRGPMPITVKHAALGSCAGLGVVTLADDGGPGGTLTHRAADGDGRRLLTRRPGRLLVGQAAAVVLDEVDVETQVRQFGAGQVAAQHVGRGQLAARGGGHDAMADVRH